MDMDCDERVSHLLAKGLAGARQAWRAGEATSADGSGFCRHATLIMGRHYYRSVVQYACACGRQAAAGMAAALRAPCLLPSAAHAARARGAPTRRARPLSAAAERAATWDEWEGAR